MPTYAGKNVLAATGRNAPQGAVNYRGTAGSSASRPGTATSAGTPVPGGTARPPVGGAPGGAPPMVNPALKAMAAGVPPQQGGKQMGAYQATTTAAQPRAEVADRAFMSAGPAVAPGAYKTAPVVAQQGSPQAATQGAAPVPGTAAYAQQHAVTVPGNNQFMNPNAAKNQAVAAMGGAPAAGTRAQGQAQAATRHPTAEEIATGVGTGLTAAGNKAAEVIGDPAGTLKKDVSAVANDIKGNLPGGGNPMEMLQQFLKMLFGDSFGGGGGTGSSGADGPKWGSSGPYDGHHSGPADSTGHSHGDSGPSSTPRLEAYDIKNPAATSGWMNGSSLNLKGDPFAPKKVQATAKEMPGTNPAGFQPLNSGAKQTGTAQASTAGSTLAGASTSADGKNHGSPDKDGSTGETVTYEDGTTSTTTPDGNTFWTYPNGTNTITHGGGNQLNFNGPVSDVTGNAGGVLNQITGAMTDNDVNQWNQHSGGHFNDVNSDSNALLQQVLDSYGAQNQRLGDTAEEAARGDMMSAVNSQRDFALREQAARRSSGGALGEGGDTGIYNSAMNQMQAGERGLAQDAYGREMGRLGAQGNAANNLASMLTSGNQMDREELWNLMSTNKEAFNELLGFMGEAFPF